MTTFVGRCQELSEIQSLFQQGKRLGTVVDIGDIGNTRMVLELRTRLRSPSTHRPRPARWRSGRTGALHVGLLRGAPSGPETADIYRVVPGHQPQI